MKPVSPSHSLQYINGHIKTEEILYHLHQDLIKRNERSKVEKYESPLVSLIKGIRLILEKVDDGEVIPLSPNPYNENGPIRFSEFDLDRAIKHDIKLLKQQLRELEKIYKEIKESGLSTIKERLND